MHPKKILPHPHPNQSKKLSAAGLLDLKRREGTRYEYYNDAGRSKGNCTWGVGFLEHLNVCTEKEMKKVVTKEAVNAKLLLVVMDTENAIRRNVHADLTQDQFDALVSYVYNRGPSGAFVAITHINRGFPKLAAYEMRQHVTASLRQKDGTSKIVRLKGLVTRREEESLPFLRVETIGVSQ